MIFLVAMPVLFGLVNYVLPLQIGARDMAFPRLNAFGFWWSRLVEFCCILVCSRRRSSGRLVLLRAFERDALFFISGGGLLGGRYLRPGYRFG